MFLSDMDTCTPGHFCEVCGAVATEAIEVESEYGGRFWETYCKVHAGERLDRLQAEYEQEKREEEREMGFCPFCGHRKDAHDPSCYDYMGYPERERNEAEEREEELLALAARTVKCFEE